MTRSEGAPLSTYQVSSSEPTLTAARLLEIDREFRLMERAIAFRHLFQSRLEAEAWILETPVVIHPRIYNELLRLSRICAVSRRLRCRVMRPRITLGHLAAHQEGRYGD